MGALGGALHDNVTFHPLGGVYLGQTIRISARLALFDKCRYGCQVRPRRQTV